MVASVLERQSIEVEAPQAWRVQGQQLALSGSESYDQAIEIACRNAPEAFRAEVLQEWGIADAVLQIRAYAAMQQLEHDDPIRKLSNSQRLALFSQGELSAPFLFQMAREHLNNGRPPGRLTPAWAASQVTRAKADTKQLSENCRRRQGYRTKDEMLADAERENRSLIEQLRQAEQIILAMEAEIQNLKGEGY